MTSERAEKVFGLGDSIAAESELQVIRAERAARRQGKHFQNVKDVGEDEGVDYDAPDGGTGGMDHGFLLEPFNMRRENQEGKFDDDGNYVRDVEMEKQVTDSWLDTVDEGAKESTFQTEFRRKQAIIRFNSSLVRLEDSEALRGELVAFLQPKETPQSALSRLSGHVKKAVSAPKLPWEKRKGKPEPKAKVAPKAKKPRRKLTEWGYEPAEGEEPAAAEKENTQEQNEPAEAGTKRAAPAAGDAKRAKTEDPTQKVMDRVTEICDQLMQQGYFDVIHTAKEQINKMVRAQPDQEPDQPEEEEEKKDEEIDSDDDEATKIDKTFRAAGLVVADPTPVAEPEETEDVDMMDLLGDVQETQADGLWQYKWTEDGETFGPFPTEQMWFWRGAGVFGADGVWARRVDASSQPLDDWSKLQSDPPADPQANGAPPNAGSA